MAEFPALPLWTDAFVADTQHLTTDQVGAYCLLLFAAWRRPKCDLPDDDKFLAKVARCDGRKWKHMRPILAEFHIIEDGTWRQKRLQKERKYVGDLSNKQRAIANARWSKINGIADASAMPNACQIDAPIPIPKKEVSKKVVVRASRWHPDAAVPDDWLTQAMAKRASHGMPPIDLKLEAERFANFWSAKSGAGASKLDWHKTWINWILKAEAPRHGHGKQTAHDKFFAAGLKIIHGLDAPSGDAVSEGGDGTQDNQPDGPSRPLLPP